MKIVSFNKDFLKRRSSWKIMLVAVLIAYAMWYAVNRRDSIESQVEISLNYTDIPPNLIVTDGLVNKLTVRLKGPPTLVGSIPRERLTRAISLASIKKGVSTVPLPSQDISPLFRAFNVVDVDPPRITVTADTLAERSVPIHTKIDESSLHNAVNVDVPEVEPRNVILRGPAEKLASIHHLTLTIHPRPNDAGTQVEEDLPLDTDSLITANPPFVHVKYKITTNIKEVNVIRKISIIHGAGDHYKIEPREVNLTVEAPETLLKSHTYLNALEASVAPPPLNLGESRKVRLKFNFPEGMSLVKSDIDEVIITRIKK